MDECTRCGIAGHCARDCKQPLPDPARATILAIVLALAGCAAGPEVITEAKDCAAEGGCIVVSWGAVGGLVERAFRNGAQRGAASCRRSDL